MKRRQFLGLAAGAAAAIPLGRYQITHAPQQRVGKITLNGRVMGILIHEGNIEPMSEHEINEFLERVKRSAVK